MFENEPIKYPVSRHVGFNLEMGKAVLLDEYCQTMQRKKGDVLREALEEWMRSRGVLR